MILLLSFLISPTQFSIRLSLSVLSCLYKPHLTSVHYVRTVHACLVENLEVSADAHRFTNPGGALIPSSDIYGITLV